MGMRDTKKNLEVCPGQCFMGSKAMEEKEDHVRKWTDFLECSSGSLTETFDLRLTGKSSQSPPAPPPLILKIYLFLFYVYEYTVAVFRHTRTGHQIPSQMVVSHHVVSGN